MFEKVNPGHPDKMADRLSGAIVDLVYERAGGLTKANPRVACEVMAGHGRVDVQIETSLGRMDLRADDIDPLIRRLFGERVVGNVLIAPQDAHLSENQTRGLRCGDGSATDREALATEGTQERHHRSEERVYRCGDNGIFKGVPPTYEQKLLTAFAESLYERWPYDGKYIIDNTIAKLTDKATGKPLPFASERNIKGFTICQSNASKEELFAFIEEIAKEKGGHFIGDDKNGAISVDENKCCILIPDDKSEQMWGFYVNPLGPWTGGIDVDCGAVNRKLGSDQGDGVSGGGLHGKDLSKSDVSVNIVAFLKAVQSGQTVTAMCSIGDESVTFQYADGRRETETFADIVEMARLYIMVDCNGSFETFSEWGLIRPKS